MEALSAGGGVSRRERADCRPVGSHARRSGSVGRLPLPVVSLRGGGCRRASHAGSGDFLGEPLAWGRWLERVVSGLMWGPTRHSSRSDHAHNEVCLKGRSCSVFEVHELDDRQS